MWKVLVAVDGSERSLDAVRHVIDWAHHGLRLQAVLAHVQEPATLYEMVMVRDPERIAAASQEAGQHLLAPAQALLEAAQVPSVMEVAVGDPATVLLEMVDALGVQAVVLGAQGHGALEGVLVGSVSRAVARASRVPVTLVKHPDPGDEAWIEAPQG